MVHNDKFHKPNETTWHNIKTTGMVNVTRKSVVVGLEAQDLLPIDFHFDFCVARILFGVAVLLLFVAVVIMYGIANCFS